VQIARSLAAGLAANAARMCQAVARKALELL